MLGKRPQNDFIPDEDTPTSFKRQRSMDPSLSASEAQLLAAVADEDVNMDWEGPPSNSWAHPDQQDGLDHPELVSTMDLEETSTFATVPDMSVDVIDSVSMGIGEGSSTAQSQRSVSSTTIFMDEVKKPVKKMYLDDDEAASYDWDKFYVDFDRLGQKLRKEKEKEMREERERERGKKKGRLESEHYLDAYSRHERWRFRREYNAHELFPRYLDGKFEGYG